MSFVVAIVLVFHVESPTSICVAQKPTKSVPRRLVKPSDKSKHGIPAWARGARWYQIVVPRFHNGDRLNDLPGKLPWMADWLADGRSVPVNPIDLDARAYGGDLQGLEQRLPYLKELGVNALHLTHLFHRSMTGRNDKLDCRHIDDVLGVKGSLAQITGETDDPATWKFSASDRIFLDFLKRAHKQGFHIVVEIVVDKNTVEKRPAPIARRWMDPNGDGDPSDGLDGWVLDELGRGDPAFSNTWRGHIKKINPNAIFIGNVADHQRLVSRPEFDLFIMPEVGDAIRRFFADTKPAYRLEDFLNDLTAMHVHDPYERRLAVLTPLGGPRTGRFLTARSTPAGKPDRLARDRAQLAIVVQHFVAGAPLTYYGEEVGMYGGKGSLSRAPMWWNDLPDASSKTVDYRGDFAALIQWLHVRRGMETPLLRGGFHPIMLDEKRRLFAFARTLPDDEVILVVNYGGTKHKVMLQAGKPGQMVGILSPQFGRFAPRTRSGRQPGEPVHTLIHPLWIGGSRQYVDAGRHIRLWVTPMSVRVVLVRKPR